jgi:uncharacterized protein YjiS (DUF1127 family)
MPTMTIAYASTQGRSLASTLDFAGLVDRASAAWTQHRTYRATLAELRDLPPRALRDLGFDRDDLATIARRAVYGR